MSEFETLVHLKPLQASSSLESWLVEVSCDGESRTGTIRNPFNEEEELAFKWYFEEYPFKDPYATGRAALVEDAIESYGKSLFEDLLPLLEGCGLDITSTTSILQISGSPVDDSIHMLHWETLEHPSFGLQLFICRGVAGSYQHRMGQNAPKMTEFNLLFITSRLIDEVQVDTDHQPVLKSFIESFTKLDPSSGIHFDVVRPGTLGSLRQYLRNKHYDLVHFDVHGKAKTHEEYVLF
jgi:hypothetical protein